MLNVLYADNMPLLIVVLMLLYDYFISCSFFISALFLPIWFVWKILL